MKEFKGFRRGVNLGGWLSQCDYSKERLEGFISEKDFETIASWGVDHVRLPVDYNVLENDGARYSEQGFGYVDLAVKNARDNGLNILIDLHKTAGFMFDVAQKETGFFDDEKLQERFYRLWEELARRYGNDPEHVAFELLNEVTDREFCEPWNRIAGVCIDRIRNNAPDTAILVGGYHNNHVKAVKDLAAPHDENVVYNFHCYDPLIFTHQHAYWVYDQDVDKDVSYEDSGATEEYFEELFADAIKKAEDNNTVLYCGEYGVIDKATPADTLKWFEAIHAVFERHNISRCVWSYKEMDFGLTDERLDGVRQKLTELL